VLSAFAGDERRYLVGDRHNPGERRLARLATVGADGMPHVAPVGWSYNADLDTIDVGGHSLAATKKYRDVARTGRAAIVIDNVLPPWQPRGIEVRGRADVLTEPATLIRIHPRRIVSWGIHSANIGERHARSVGDDHDDRPRQP
jgi:pyridoxamine 5'-phosphate oxidase family protein